MRIVILTQSDPFYLAENLDYLINNFPKHSNIVAAVIFDVSPFGKRETFLQKSKRTIKVFGINFFIRYGFVFLLNFFKPTKSVKKVMNKHGIPVIKLNYNINHSDSLNRIKSYSPDLLISIAGNQIFKQPLIDLAPKGCLNLHTALLPKYRGLMPSFWVLKNNEQKTGVSVFFVDKGIDSGPILVQKSIDIVEGMSQEELIKISKKLGMDAVIEAVDLIYKDNYQLIPNPNKEKTYFSFPKRNDVKEFKKAGKKFY